MPEPCSTSVSAEMLAVPVATRPAPDPIEFAQPSPAPSGERFPHGHAAPEPSPAQYAKLLLVPPGPSTLTPTEPCVPERHRPIVALTMAGGASASKRKLYVVPQRSAFA